MLRRLLTSLALAAIGLPAIIYGGVFYWVVITIFIGGAAWEFVRLYRAVHYEPHEGVTVGGVLLIATVRFFFAEAALPLLVVLIFLAMTVHLIAFERGRDHAALDFCVTVAGIVYICWIGSYFIDLRNHFGDLGGWWLMLVLPIVWAGDTGAYSIGAAYGRHKMTPRLSPKKSWEGYAAGVFTAVLIGAFFAHAYTAVGARQPLHGLITPLEGALLGLVIGALTPLRSS